MPAKIIIILNPFAKSRRAEKQIDRLCRMTGNTSISLTSHPGDATQKAAQAAKKGVSVVVAAGGDGTVNEVLNGLAGTSAALGILPIGTMNVVARQLGLPLKLRDAWQVIQTGATRAIDIGLARFQFNGVPQKRHFAQMAGIGLDAQIVREVTWKEKQRWGPSSYLLTALKVIPRPAPPIRIGIKNGPSWNCAFALAGNGNYYGGPFPVFAKARLDDQLLDLCTFDSGGWRGLERFLRLTLLGPDRLPKGLQYRQTPAFTATATGDVPVQLDGEFVGCLPAAFRVIPNGLRVVTPSTS
ncbi:MAG: diacylglycerol kinase family lipid kinase [Verrucomicrobiae bacterium]|nr:diacylglycerol kinase family lipid kinase [Verrucomicrobiae bacterium]